VNKAFIYILFLAPLRALFGQAADTLQLCEIPIEIQTNKVVGEFDSIIKQNPFFTVSEILTDNSLGQTNLQGGKGAVSTLSLRGLTSSHTSVRWNGVNINSLAVGQQDFGGLMTGVLDRAALIKGNAVSEYSDASIGGVVLLGNELNWEKPFSISIGEELGSFGFNSSIVNLSISKRGFSSRLRWGVQEAENDFEYVNFKKIGQPKEVQEHAYYLNNNYQFSVGWKNKKLKIVNHSWWFDKRVETPKTYSSNSIGTAVSFDSSFKNVSIIHTQFNKINFKFIYGLTHDRYLYEDLANAIHTYYVLNNHQPIINVQYSKNGWKLKGVSDFQFQNAKNNQFDGVKQRNVNLTKITSEKLFKRISLNLFSTVGLNSVLNGFTYPVLNLGYGWKYKSWVLKGGGGNHYRLAAFNDLFWPIGGNENLNPETGWSIEQSLAYRKKQKQYSFGVFTEGYYSIIDDWIQWVQSQPFWEVRNVKKVNAKGVELGVDFNTHFKKINVKLESKYALTQTTTVESGIANDPSIGKQSIYVPLHKNLNKINLSFKGYKLSYAVNYFGRRFESYDNLIAKSLDPYLIQNLFLGKEWNFRKYSVLSRLSVLNINNLSYEGLGNRPMPGRAVYLSLVLKFN